jgi:hypothetical protein
MVEPFGFQLDETMGNYGQMPSILTRCRGDC